MNQITEIKIDEWVSRLVDIVEAGVAEAEYIGLAAKDRIDLVCDTGLDHLCNELLTHDTTTEQDAQIALEATDRIAALIDAYGRALSHKYAIADAANLKSAFRNAIHAIMRV